MNLTKKHLSVILKKELKLSVEISDSLVDEFFQAIKMTLRSKKNLKLSGFGSFEIYSSIASINSLLSDIKSSEALRSNI